MGVEYCHGIVVRDLSWTPTPLAIANVIGVCSKWSLASAFEVLSEADPDRAGFTWTKSKMRAVELSTIPSDLPDNVVLKAAEAPKGQAVTHAIGPASSIGFPDESRYLMSLKLIFGLDFQIFPKSETLHCQAEALAVEANGEPVMGRNYEAFDTADLEEIEAFLSPPAIHPPPISAQWDSRQTGTDYSGCFRSGMIVDCGKNLLDGLHGSEPLTNTVFVADVEDAFGTEVVQFGYYH